MWKNLTTWQKVCFIFVTGMAVPFAPELIFIADVGDMELVFSFLVLYYRPLFIEIKTITRVIKSELKRCILCFKSSSVMKANVFATQALFSCGAILITGSLTFLMWFFMPALMLNTVV